MTGSDNAGIFRASVSLRRGRRLALLVATVALVSVGDAFAATPKRPNIILVMSDDQGWGDVGYNGNRVAKTPELDALAREGLRLDRFYTAGPVCSPTRGSCLTGRHPYRYGIPWASGDPTFSLPAEEVTLAETLRAAGYATGHFGKWHLGEFTDERIALRTEPLAPGQRKELSSYSPPWENGFDVCFSDLGGPTYNPMVWGRDKAPGNRIIMNRPVAWGETAGVGSVVPSGVKFWTGANQTAGGVLAGDSSKVIMDRAIGFIEQAVQSRDPFLAVIWLFTPHSPIAAGNSHRELYPGRSIEEQHWYGCISAMDEQIGRLRRELRALGVSDDTILWFCSDNGPSWVIREFNSSGPFRGEKGLLYEGGVHVPGLVEWPGRFKQPAVITAPICTSDFYPTLLACAGVAAGRQPRPLDGIDVLPLLEAHSAQRPAPIFFQSPVRKGLGHDWSTDPNHWKMNPDPATQQLAVVDNDFKLISSNNGKTYELYDLKQDPSESKDIAAAHPQRVEALSAALARWRESCRRSLAGEDYIAAGSK